jgi:hypothetical protein
LSDRSCFIDADESDSHNNYFSLQKKKYNRYWLRQISFLISREKVLFCQDILNELLGLDYVLKM